MKRYTYIIMALSLLPSVWTGAAAQTVEVDSLGAVKSIAYSTSQLIQGQVSGVRVSATDNNPNGALITNIRGLNTLRGDSQPLWIVDGTELNSSLYQNSSAFWQDRYGDCGYTSALNDLDFLSPYQIESIEVLKNTSATALYGAKGANGVIIVNTKMARKDGRVIRWNSNFGINAPATNVGKATLSHNHTILLTQSRKRTSYSLSAFFRGNKGALPDVGGNYASLKANFETKANNVVQFGLNTIANLGRTHSTLGTAKYGEISRTIATRYRDVISPDGLDGENAWISDYKDDVESYRSITSVFLDFNILPGFTLKTKGGMDYEYQDRYMWYDNATSFGLANNGAASIMATSLLNYNASAELAYQRFFAKVHNFSVKAAFDVNGGFYKYGVMNANDFFTHVLGAKGLAFGASKDEPHKFNQNAMQMGILGEISYSYKGIINLKGGVRADTTPKYDQGRFFIYPNGEASIDFHRAFFKDYKPISTFSIEGGYGESARERYLPYEQYCNYTAGPNPGIDRSIAVYFDAFGRVVTKEWHVGLNLGFASDRVKLGVQYYDKLSDDGITFYDNSAVKKVLIPQPILKFGPRTKVDEYSYLTTIGNRGFEFDLTARAVKTRDWTLDLYANASYNVNQILKVDAAEQYGPRLGGMYGLDVAANVNAAGLPVSAFYGYKTDEDGFYKDITGDGYVTGADRVVLGNPTPKYFGSFGATLSFKGLSFDFRFDGAGGFNILDMNSMFADGATEVSDLYIAKGDYLRLANIGLTYNIPLKVKWIKGFKLNASAHNVATFTDYKGYDPDVNSFGINNLTTGADYGSYPMARTFVLGFQFNF